MSRAWTTALLFLLFVYACVRAATLPLVMTHVDDIGPLTLMLQHSAGGSWQDLWRALRVWTYPPGPYLLQWPLLQLAWDPWSAVAAVRVVSLAAWAAGLVLFWGLLRDLGRRAPGAWDAWTRVLLMAWALLSWRGIIESSQGYPYAWGFLTATFYLRYFFYRAGVRGPSLADRGGLTDGLFLGALVFFSYQAPPLAAATFLALFLLRLLRRQGWALKQDGLAALGHLPWHLLAWDLHLRYLPLQPGHPPWALGYPDPGAAWTARLGQWADGAFQAWSSLLTVAPWGAATWALGCAGALLALAGLARRRHGGTAAPAALLALALALVWSAAAWTLRFPLGPTRHVFVLQAPVLLALGAGLGLLPRAGKAAVAAVLLACFAWSLPGQVRGLRNRVDLDPVRLALDADPGLVAAQGTLAYTVDHLLLAVGRPDLAPRLTAEELEPILARRPAGLLLLSHRGPLHDLARQALARHGYGHRPLAAVAPLGSTELAGNLNGGNGYYLELARPLGSLKP